MKKLLTAITILTTTFLFSCQKEDSIETGNNGGGGTGGNTGKLLLRNVATISASDSIGYIYAYDNNRRLISSKSFVEVTGMKAKIENAITRNTTGIITNLVTTITNSAGSITMNYVVNYNTANNRYTSKITTRTAGGGQVKDSVAYEYDGAGLLVKETTYSNSGNSGGYVEGAKNDFVYSAGNLVKYTASLFNPGTARFEAVSETTLQYDAKVNPVILGSEAIVLGLYESAAVNNVVKYNSVDFTDPSNNEEVTFVYTYNAENKPSKAEATYSGFPVTFNFTYQ